MRLPASVHVSAWRTWPSLKGAPKTSTEDCETARERWESSEIETVEKDSQHQHPGLLKEIEAYLRLTIYQVTLLSPTSSPSMVVSLVLVDGVS